MFTVIVIVIVNQPSKCPQTSLTASLEMPTPRLCKAKINLIDLAGSERTSKAWEHECLTKIDGTKKSTIFSLFYGLANVLMDHFGPFLDRFGSASAAFWRHRLSMKG